jgi:hypothetical protein
LDDFVSKSVFCGKEVEKNAVERAVRVLWRELSRLEMADSILPMLYDKVDTWFGEEKGKVVI